MNETPEDMAVDAEEVQDEELDLMFSYKNRDSESDEPIDLVSDYLPQENDWSAKTRLDIDHPEKMTAVELLTDLYPEINEMEGPLDQWIHQYEKRLTSVGGVSREEYVRILEAMLGSAGSKDGEEGLLHQVLSIDNEED